MDAMMNEETGIKIQTVELAESSNDREAREVQDAVELERRSAERLASRPYIDHLQDAIVDGVFTVPPGQKVIIERFVTIGPKTLWLDTRSYIVRSVDETNGNIILFDPDMKQSAMSNYIVGPKRGYRFKVSEKGVRLSGRGKSRPKKRLTAQKKETGKRGNPGKPGMRRIYDVKKLGICTRLKGVAYVAREGTQAVAGDRLMVSAPVDGVVTVSHPENGWSESWDERPGA